MNLPNEHHFVRYCRPTAHQNGNILVAAFRLRDNEDGLSGNHFEHFKDNEYDNIVIALKKSFPGLKKDGLLMKLNCGSVISKVRRDYQQNIHFLKDHPDNSHALLVGICDDSCKCLPALVIEKKALSEYM